MPTPEREPMEDRILRAAEECFVRFGIAKTTMEDVARAGGVSRATVYRCFPDRDSLIDATIRRRSLAYREEHLALLERWETFTEQLVEGVCDDVRRGSEDPVLELLGVAPRMASTAIGRPYLYADLMLELWEPVFERARSTGELRPEIQEHDLADWLARLEIMFLAQFGGEDDTSERIRHYMRTFVVPAIVVPAPLPAGTSRAQ